MGCFTETLFPPDAAAGGVRNCGNIGALASKILVKASVFLNKLPTQCRSHSHVWCNNLRGLHFPIELSIRRRWVQLIKREEVFKALKHSIVCRAHFREEDKPTSVDLILFLQICFNFHSVINTF